MPPRFSIIIPIFNVEAYLCECLDSVAAQSFPHYEVVMVDDGSTDGSHQIAAEYAQRPHWQLLTQPNGGLSAARNAGLARAAGQYVLFLDSDDWLAPDALSRLDAHLDGQDMLCFSGYIYDDASRHALPPDALAAASYPTGRAYYAAEALRPRTFPFVCVVLRCYRRQFLEASDLRFYPGIYHEDNLFTPLACYHAARVGVIADALYYYRRRGGSITARYTPRHRHDRLVVANLLAEQFVGGQGEAQAVFFRAVAQLYQSAYLHASSSEARSLHKLTHWQHYRAVSRTRPRHRLNYFLIRHLFPLYAFLYRHEQ